MPSRTSPDLVIVAPSARALAAVARAAGYAPLTIDLFGDDDTRALAADHMTVAARGGFGFAPDALRAALNQVRARHGVLPVLCTSGFEAAPALLADIARRHRVLGVDADVYRRLADVPTVWRRLARHPGLLLPATRLTPPRDVRGWLTKRMAATGGWHVRVADGRSRRDEYHQRRVPGSSVSALYLSDGATVRLCGMAEHLCWAVDPQRSGWRYEGARVCTRVPRAWAQAARAAGRAVVAELGLRGCFGLDFIARADQRLALVDINPRPPATLELYADCAEILRAHLRACSDEGLLYSRPRRGPWCAHLVLYASASWTVAEAVRWPRAVTDRPVAGSHVARGAPLCSLKVSATTPALGMAALTRAHVALRRALGEPARAVLPPTIVPRVRKS